MTKEQVLIVLRDELEDAKDALSYPIPHMPGMVESIHPEFLKGLIAAYSDAIGLLTTD